MDKHVNIISILWIVYGAMGLVWAFGLFWLLFGIAFIPDIGQEAAYILRGSGIFVSVFIAVFSIPERRRQQGQPDLGVAEGGFGAYVKPSGRTTDSRGMSPRRSVALI